MGYAARLRIAQSARATLVAADPEIIGTFVRLITGKGLGVIESVTGDTATVFDLSILMRACEP